MTNEMTAEEAIKVFKSELDWAEQNRYPYISENKVKAIKLAIQALDVYEKIRTSADCISRQAVIDYAKDTCLDLDKYEDTEVFCDEIKAMPPVTPERPKGKWMECGGDEPWLKGYCCSLCNFTTTQKYDYCTCGAEMSGGGEDEVSD